MARKAEQIIRHDKNYPATIIAAFIYQPRSLTDIEVAALIIHYISLHNRLAGAVGRLAKREAQKLLTEMEEAERVLCSINTKSDCGLIARKMALSKDYSLTGLTLKATAAKGEKLNPREQKVTARIAGEINRLQDLQKKKQQPKRKHTKKKTLRLSKSRPLLFGTESIVD